MPRYLARTPSPLTALAALTVGALVLAGCGSQLEPEDVARTQQQGTVIGLDPTSGQQTQGVPQGGDPNSVPSSGASQPGAVDPGGAAPPSGSEETNGVAPTEAPTNKPPVDKADAAGCDGFKNGPGITDTTITIGNASDITGPIPGLFQSTQDGVTAFVAYFNATSDICGRKLKVTTYDTKTDAGADNEAYAKGCAQTFAMVGSMSAFDSGGAKGAQSCGLPDLRTASVTKARADCTTCFGTQGTRSTEWPNIFADFIKDNYGTAAQHAAMIYLNAGGAAEAAKNEAKALSKRGLKFVYEQGIETSDFNYVPYVQNLKNKKVEAVFFVGAYQQSLKLRQAMQQQGYTPKVYFRDPSDYTPEYVRAGGAAVEGTVVAVNFLPFEEANTNDEAKLYLAWLGQVKPGAAPTFFGVYAWSAARLFVERATALGGKLTRPALIAAIAKVDDWTANGLTAPQPVGTEHVTDCWRFLQLKGGKWVPTGARKYTCNGLSVV